MKEPLTGAINRHNKSCSGQRVIMEGRSRYNAWPVQDGAPEFGIGTNNHGGWLVPPGRAPGFGLGVGPNNDRWWPVHQRVPGFGIEEGNYGERPLLAGAPGFGICVGNDRQRPVLYAAPGYGIREDIPPRRPVQCGAPGFGFDAGMVGVWPQQACEPRFPIAAGNDGRWPALPREPGFCAGNHGEWPVQGGALGFVICANYTRMLVPVCRPLLRIAVWLPVQGVVPAIPPYPDPDPADFANLPEDYDGHEIGEEENEINAEASPNAVEEILERVCESNELGELTVEEILERVGEYIELDELLAVEQPGGGGVEDGMPFDYDNQEDGNSRPTSSIVGESSSEYSIWQKESYLGSYHIHAAALSFANLPPYPIPGMGQKILNRAPGDPSRDNPRMPYDKINTRQGFGD